MGALLVVAAVGAAMTVKAAQAVEHQEAQVGAEEVAVAFVVLGSPRLAPAPVPPVAFASAFPLEPAQMLVHESALLELAALELAGPAPARKPALALVLALVLALALVPLLAVAARSDLFAVGMVEAKAGGRQALEPACYWVLSAGSEACEEASGACSPRCRS